MPLQALFSFDVYPGTANGTGIIEAVGEIIGPRKTRRLLQRLWQIDFKSEGDFESFGKRLAKLHDDPKVGKVFDYVALLWRTTSNGVFIIHNERPTADTGMKTAATVAIHELGEEGVEAFFNQMENSRAFRDLLQANLEQAAAPVVLPVVATAARDGGRPVPRRTPGKGTGRRHRK